MVYNLKRMSRSISDLLRIFKSGVSAVRPENLINNSVKYNFLTETLTIKNDEYDLKNKNVHVIGAGKAVQNMAMEIEKILGTKIKIGIISVPAGSSNLNMSYTKSVVGYYEGAKNNLPDADAEQTAKKIANLVVGLKSEDLLLVILSGGGSALLPLAKDPVNLKEKTNVIKSLANAGADITELNTVRKKISELKGGKLAIKAQPATIISLILSDIVGDPLDLIASGPTSANCDTDSAAIDIIKKYSLTDKLPESVKIALNSNHVDNQPFPKDNIHNYIIGSNIICIKAALEEASANKYAALCLSKTVTGNVKTIATEYSKLTEYICGLTSGKLNVDEFKLLTEKLSIPGLNKDLLSQLDAKTFFTKPLCLILGGEITVEVKGKGKGGRNQHLALEFSNNIYGNKNLDNFEVCFLSAGTDGIDGPTDAAGAIGYKELIADARKEGFNVTKYLNENDSYNFYRAFKNGKLHVITGHTKTNVMDLHIILIKSNPTTNKL